MYAIVEILGKQYKVEKDKFIYTDRLDAKVGKTISFTDVLFIENKGPKFVVMLTPSFLAIERGSNLNKR